MNKRKGFTLIELLAVIVILGLLMAIAIPSVTKYITESRKKTVTSTIGNYISALVNEVNDLTYTFTGDNMIYAVPIECIPLERGGTNPFGAWHQSNDAYFAYVLVQYDDETSSYRYGYTFKDSAGYGLYPTTQANLDESGKQIQTGLSISQPKSGNISNVATLEVWENSGFEVSDTTQLKVLVAEAEGNVGDGVNTCTLCQKGDNYIQVENNKDNDKTEVELPMLNSLASIVANNDIPYFYPYIEQIKSITFENKINVPSGNETYDFSSTKNGKVMSFIRNHPTEVGYYDLVIQGDGKIYANPDSSYFFSIFGNVTNINNIELLNTSRVTNMEAMFADSLVSELNLSSWDTSSVTNMDQMFHNMGRTATTFKLNLSNWDTSKVTNMNWMFVRAGENAATFDIDLSNWDTSNVTNMKFMFHSAGIYASTFNISGLSSWNTSKVTNMEAMFTGAGENATTFNIGDLSNWKTSNVTTMSNMFAAAGSKATTFNIGDLSKWNTSKVTTMEFMFSFAGANSTTFNIGDLSSWDTSKVTTMSHMFQYAGNTSTWSLECSNWNVLRIIDHTNFNNGVESKVIPPQWKS